MSRMHVMVVGIRGFPGIQGGVETHSEALYPRLAASDCKVTVLTRAMWVAEDAPREWRGVHFVRLWSPRQSGAEAFLHTALGVLYAAFKRPDILHFHAVGPSVFVPLARLLGLRVVATHHGRNYELPKWGRFARALLKTGERWAARYANALICVARNDADRLAECNPGRQILQIPNGVAPRETPPADPVIDTLGLMPGRYIVHVGRVTLEKRQMDAVDAFIAAKITDWKLVIVGGEHGAPEYAAQLHAKAAACPGIVLAGFRQGAALAALYANAGLFVLPSSHEGLPIALLEALSFGLPCLASDIPANREISLPPENYFPVGDVVALARLMQSHCRYPMDESGKEARIRYVRENFDWDEIAGRVEAVYRRVLA